VGWDSSASAESSASPQALWDTLLDGRRWSGWHPGVEWMVIEGPLEPGALLTIKLRRFLQTALTIETAEAPATLAFWTTFGPVARVDVRFTIDSIGSSTRIEQRVTAAGPLSDLLAKGLARKLSADTSALDRLCALASEERAG
jgi:hypothetical protein